MLIHDMISNLLRHTIAVETYSTSGNKEVYSAAVNHTAFVQPLDLEDAMEADGSFQKEAKVYVLREAGIGIGDRVTWENNVYKVKGVSPYDFPNSEVEHDKLIITSVKS